MILAEVGNTPTLSKSCRIADALYISEHTVKFHVTSILAKLTASNRTEAVLTAMRYGIVKSPAGSD